MQADVNAHIDVYFDFSSPYSYLSVARIQRIAKPLHITVRLMPIALGAIFQKLGWQSSPFLEQPRKLDYMWIDVARQARKHGLEFRKPDQFPIGSIVAARVATAHTGAQWHDVFCLHVLKAYFVDNKDISQPAVIEKILRDLNLDAEEIISHSTSESAKGSLRARTEQADRLGVFGAPTMVVGDAIFWGDDRLEDAVAYCLST